MSVSDNQNKYIKSVIKERFIIKFTQIFIVILFITFWEVFANKNIIDPFIFSSPSRILLTIKNLYLSEELFSHIFTTLWEIFLAFSLGLILAFIISIIFYIFPKIAKIFDPFLTVLNSLPKVALGPMLIIITGANSKSIILMALLINLIVSIISIYNGFLNVDKIKIKMFKTFRASKKQILYKLVIPSSFSSIVASLKLTISLTLIGVISGEFLVSKKGIGYLIIYGTQIFDLNLVMAGIFILLIISYLLYKIVIIFENYYQKKNTKIIILAFFIFY